MVELEQIFLDDAAKLIVGQLTTAGMAGVGRIAKSIQHRFTHVTDVTEVSAELAEWARTEPDWQAKLQALFADTEPGAAPTVAAPPDPYIDRDALLESVRERPESVHLFHGFAGSGKTAFTYKVAEFLADVFPFNRVYLDLQRHRDNGVLRFRDAMIDVLSQLGIAETDIADGEIQLERQYFGVLLGRRVLLIIDNAETEAELTRLAPNWSSCLVIATTRTVTADLEAKYRPARLTGLSSDDAIALLRAARPELGEMIDQEPGTAVRLLDWFDNMPLAIAEVGALLRDRLGEYHAIATLLADFEAAGITGLAELTSVRLAAAVGALPPDAARIFPLLAAVPAADFSLNVAAFLFGTTERDARNLLRDLTRAALLTGIGGGRHRLPHFIRDYAKQRAGADLTLSADRLADYYLRTAIAADQIGPERLPRVPMPVAEQVWTDSAAAIRWLDDNREALGALVERCYHAGRDEQAAQLATALENLVLSTKRYGLCLTAFEFAADAAQRNGWRRLHARMLSLQGRILVLLRVFDRARPLLAEAADIARAEGDTHQEASIAEFTGLYHLLDSESSADAVYRRAALERAAVSYAHAATIDQRIGHHRAYGIHARMLANVQVMLGRADDALRTLSGLDAIFGAGEDRNRSRVATVRAKAYSLLNTQQARAELARARDLAARSNALTSYAEELDDVQAEIEYRTGDLAAAHVIWGRLLQQAQASRHPRADVYLAKLSWPRVQPR